MAQKAVCGRQLTVRSVREARASWSQIGAALGAGKQAAREAHTRWIDAQAGAYGKPGQMGFDPADEAEARAVAGEPKRGDAPARNAPQPARNEWTPSREERNEPADTCKVAALRP